MLSASTMRILESFLSYLMLDLFFEGGVLFWIIELFYIYSFERLQRQRSRFDKEVRLGCGQDKEEASSSSYSEEGEVKVPDWEDPAVVGRYRRRAHTPLRAFPDVPISLAYWSRNYQCGGGQDDDDCDVDAEDEDLRNTMNSGSPRKRKSSVFVPSTEVNSQAFKKTELTSNIMYLTGQCGEPDERDPWRFMLVGEPKDCPTKWTEPGYYDLGIDWQDIALPGHWQLQGHDIPIYTNTSYPFAFDPPRARRTGVWKVADCDAGIGSSTETEHPNGAALHAKEPGENPTGLYRRTFALPHTWVDPSMPSGMGYQAASASTKGRSGDAGLSALPDHRVFLVFEGVDAAFNVYVNGVHVGYSQDSCLTAEFEISDSLLHRLPGQEHVIAVQVMRWCDGSYLEDQDKWWLSGIYREIYLIRKPVTHIADFEFSSDLVERGGADAGSGSETDGKVIIDAEFALQVLVEETYPSEAPLAVRAELRRLDYSVSGRSSHSVSSVPACVCCGLMETNKDLPMRENADGLANVAAEAGLCEERGFTDLDGDYLETSNDWCRKHIVKLVRDKDPSRLEDDDFKALLASSTGGEASRLLRRLYDEYDVPLSESPINSFRVRDCKKRRGCAELSGKVLSPALWTAESPNLYVLVLTLHSSLEDAEQYNPHMGDLGGNSAPLDVESSRVGFRSVAFLPSSGLLAVNNVPITLCGVNRHEFHSARGRAVSERDMVHDAALLKQFNFNAVRTSHYPNHPRWLEICDMCGLYVVDEANIETHGFQVLGQATSYLSGHPDWQDAFLSRLTRMVERDKNHTSVISWSLGNESGCGATTRIMADWVRMRDFGRCVQYESGGARSDATDIICPMYQRPSWCREQALYDAKNRPVILCEYAHAMGNSGGCLKQYWDDIWGSDYPRIQGAFIWDMIDQGLKLTPECSNYGGYVDPGYGYGGDFGDLPNTRQFCINGLFGPDRTPHPMAFEAKAVMSPVTVCLLGERDKDEDEDERKEEDQEQEQKKAREGGDTDIHYNSVREGFRLVAANSLRVRLSNRRSFTTLADLDVHLSFRCNLSSKKISVHEGGHSDYIPASTDPYRYTVCAGAAGPNGGFMDVPIHDAFEAVYRKSRNHSLDEVLGLPSTNTTPPALQPYLHSENVYEAWVEVEVVVKSDASTPYLPTHHCVHRCSLPSASLLEAILRVVDAKEQGRSSSAHVASPLSSPSSYLGYSPPTGGRDSLQRRRSSCTVLGSPSGKLSSQEEEEEEEEEEDVNGISKPKPRLRFSRGVPNALRASTAVDPEEEEEDEGRERASVLDRTVMIVEWSSGATATIGEDSGYLLAWHDAAGKPILSDAQPLGLCLYRAPTDNDRGGGPMSYCERWKAAGYDSLRQLGAPCSARAVVSVEIVDAPPSLHLGMMSAGVGERREAALRAVVDWSQQAESAPETVIPATCTMLFLPSGGIEIAFEVRLSSQLPILPRVGLRFSLSTSETDAQGAGKAITATWLGQGPHEAYPDRQQCTSLGLFQAAIHDMHTPYVVPGENGLRLDPRYVAVRGGSNSLVIIPASKNGSPEQPQEGEHGYEHGGYRAHSAAVSGYGFSVSRYSMESLASHHHEHQLCREGQTDHVFVHLDTVHMGVGGYDSWSPNTDYRYQISPSLSGHGSTSSGSRGANRSDKSQFHAKTVRGSVLLNPSHVAQDDGGFLYSEFQHGGLW